MKKLLILFYAMLVLSGCGNKQYIDLNRDYNKAIIKLQNGEVAEVEVKQWRDYENSEQIQVISMDGKVYLTSSYNCTLIKE